MKYTIQTHFDSLEEMQAHLATLPPSQPSASAPAGPAPASQGYAPPAMAQPPQQPGMQQPAPPQPGHAGQPGMQQPAPAQPMQMQQPAMQPPGQPAPQVANQPVANQQPGQMQQPQGGSMVEQIEALARELVAANKMPELLRIRDEFGLQKVTDCGPEQQPVMLQKLQALRG